jgi:hypothetical protein
VTDRLRDIRELASDSDAYRDELFRRWTGLLSYRYIGRNHSSMNLGESDDTVTIRRDMRNEAGGIMVAPLAIASPEGCQTDMVAVPNPVIASVQIIDPGHDVTRVAIVGSGIVHQGRMMGYGRCTIVDADNSERVIAFNEGQGAIIGTPPEGLDRMDVSGSELVIEDSPDLPPLWQAFGAAKRGDGHWVLPALSAELASPDAALHIGPQHVLLETAATASPPMSPGPGSFRSPAGTSCSCRAARWGPSAWRAPRMSAPRDASASACFYTTRATRTGPSPPPRPSSMSAERRLRRPHKALRG